MCLTVQARVGRSPRGDLPSGEEDGIEEVWPPLAVFISIAYYLCLGKWHTAEITLFIVESIFAFSGHLGGPVGWASDFGSGRDLGVCGFKPHVRLSALSTEPALDPLSSSLFCPSPAYAHARSLARSLSLSKINVYKKNFAFSVRMYFHCFPCWFAI